MKKVFIIILIIISISACSSRSGGSKQNSPSHSTNNHDDARSGKGYVNNGDEESNNINSQGDASIEDNDDKCKFEDGTYSASVDYYNPETSYSTTYTLDVVVQDCQVIEIDFPQGGWLDEDHITAAELDEDGNASVEGENGKTYDVHIDD